MKKPAFRSWLLSQGYQPSTVTATCLALQRLSRPYGLTGLETDKPHLRRYLSFVAATKENPLGRSFLRSVKALGLLPVSEGWSKHGRRSKSLLTSEQFAEFRAQLRKEGDVGMLTALCTQSGLRVSKLLAMRLLDAIESYPLYGKWLHAFDATKVKRLHQIVADNPRSAYLAMRNSVIAVATKLEVEADLDSLYKSRLQIEVG